MIEMPGGWKGGSKIRKVSGESRLTRRGTADFNRKEMKAESNSREKEIVIPRKTMKFWARGKKKKPTKSLQFWLLKLLK